MTAAQEAARKARVNGGAPSNLVRLPVRRKEPWELLKEWADSQGMGSWRCAGAMIRAATPQEKKSLPDQHALCSQWVRWLKGESTPDAHRGDPNVTGFYRPIIARMMGTTPEAIWPSRRSAQAGASGAQAELMFRREKTAARLARTGRELDDLRKRLERMRELEDTITSLQAELSYLDAMLAVPAPDGMTQRHVR